MDKPNANATSMSQTKENLLEYRQQDNIPICAESNFKVLDFPVGKYYPGTDLSLTKSQKHIDSAGLIEFLEKLGISFESAKYYFHEVHVYNKQTKEKLKTLGFPNENEGFELISPFFKGTIGIQSISFIRGTTPKPESIHIFKDSLDFLCFLSKIGGKKILADVIILHSNKCINQINPYLHSFGYKQVYSWMDNDKAGMEARDSIKSFIKTEESIKHKAMNNLYKPSKNVQTWYQQQIRKG